MRKMRDGTNIEHSTHMTDQLFLLSESPSELWLRKTHGLIALAATACVRMVFLYASPDSITHY